MKYATEIISTQFNISSKYEPLSRVSIGLNSSNANEYDQIATQTKTVFV